MDAGEGARFACIDSANDGMSMGAGQQPRMQHITQLDIINEGGFAGDQLDGIHFALWLAYNTEVGRGAGAYERGCTSTSRCILTGWWNVLSPSRTRESVFVV